MDLDIILEADLQPAQIRELGLLAEGMGIRGIWAQNYARARDAFMTMVPLAEASKKIRVGVVVVSPYEMHPLKIANAVMTLNEFSNGRAMVTIGGGGEWPMVMKVGYGKRITGAREAIEIVKKATLREAFTYDGKVYSALGFAAPWAEDNPPLIYGGASGPKMLDMAAATADGVMMSDMQVEMMNERLDVLRNGLAAHGRGDDEFRISNFIAWHVKEDREASLAEARRELIIRGWLEREWLEPFLEPDDVEFVLKNKMAFLKAFRERHGNIEGVPANIVDTLSEGLSLAGGPESIDRHVEKLRRFAEAGFTEIALRVHDDPAESIRMIGERVLPALR